MVLTGMLWRAIEFPAGCIAAAAVALGGVGPVAAHVESAAPSASAERDAFERLSAEANAAASAGDWPLALRLTREAFAAWPESDASRNDRAHLMVLLGEHEIEQRSTAEITESVEILRSYLAEFDRQYGERAPSLRAHGQATRYLAELESLLPPSAPPTPAVSNEPTFSDTADEPVTEGAQRGGTAMQATGGLMIGTGSLLAIGGIVFASRAADAATDYEYARGRRDGLEAAGAVTPEDDQSVREQLAEWKRSRNATLGLVLPGAVVLAAGIALVVVGTRRVRGDRRVAVAPSGVEVRF